MNTNIEIDYDSEADLLEIFMGDPSPSYFDEVDDDLFEGRDKETGRITGYKIFNLTKRKDNNWKKKISVPIKIN
jgi:uncharacterized protein YuzE